MNIEGFYLIPGHALSPTGRQSGRNSKAEGRREEGSRGKGRGSEEHEQEQELERQLAAGTAKPLPTAQREVTSILVLCNSPLGPQYLDFKINKGKGRIAQVRRTDTRSGGAAEQHRGADSHRAAGADGAGRDRGRDQHSGEHLQFDDRAEPRHCGDASARGEPQRGDGDHSWWSRFCCRWVAG